MTIVSYDISDNKVRTKFAKMLKKNGAIRLQNSVYEVQNTKRILDNLDVKIKEFAKQFCFDDSVVIFEADSNKITKYGNAIHRDKAMVFL